MSQDGETVHRSLDCRRRAKGEKSEMSRAKLCGISYFSDVSRQGDAALKQVQNIALRVGKEDDLVALAFFWLVDEMHS